jgi:hypothetical protein
MAEQFPELQAKLQELDHELQVGLFSKPVSRTSGLEWCLAYACYDVESAQIT